MRTLTLRSFVPALLLALSLAPACGGGGDDDDIVLPDASGGGTPDAGGGGGTPDASAGGTAEAIGQACTFTGALQQSDCPNGYLCVQFQGGTAAWCTKQCASMGDPTCSTGYPGPGLSTCLIGVDTTGDNMPDIQLCGVICEDLVNGSICPNCDGTCPGSLMCSGEVNGSGGQVVAKACQ